MSDMDADGITVSFNASPTGGRTIRITIKITTIISPPRTLVSVSIAFNAFLKRKITTAIAPAIKYPHLVGSPRSVLKPRAPPPTLPILKTRPPATTNAAIK